MVMTIYDLMTLFILKQNKLCFTLSSIIVEVLVLTMLSMAAAASWNWKQGHEHTDNIYIDEYIYISGGAYCRVDSLGSRQGCGEEKIIIKKSARD